MWTVEFYKTPTGDFPVVEFLNSLDRKTELEFARQKIDLLKEYGSELVLLGRTHAAYLKDGIFELRIPIQHKQFRILYFFFYNEKIILSHGIKKEKKVPPSEIDQAKRHKDYYFKTHGRQK